jgi:hypothetical protein
MIRKTAWMSLSNQAPDQSRDTKRPFMSVWKFFSNWC